MKKSNVKMLVAIAVTAVTVTGLGLGIFFGVRAIRNKKAATAAAATAAATAEADVLEISYLESEYTVGDSLVFKIVKTDKKTKTAVKFTIDNGELQSTTATVKKNADGTSTIDTGVEAFALTDVSAGDHLLTFYVYENETKREQLGESKIITLKAAA